MMQRIRLILLILSACVFTGCGASGPLYQPPTLEPGEAAILKGVNSTYVSTIDGMRVQDSLPIHIIIVDSLRGNETTAAPGQHLVAVFVDTGNQGGRTYKVTLDLAKGNTYEFAQKGMFSNRLIIKNVTADRTWAFDPDSLTIFGPSGSPQEASKPFAP